MKQVFTDANIISSILKNDTSMELAINYLYDRSGIMADVQKYIRSRSGTKEMIEDVFQEGVVHLIMNIRKGNYKGEGSIKGYLFGICRNIWLKKLNKEIRHRDEAKVMKVEEVDYQTPEYYLIDEEKKNILDKVLSRLGEMCKKVLTLWKLNYSMKEIAVEVGYKSEGVVRKKKHQCMKNLIKLVKEKPELKELLMN
jgi:RNA polymerase sigma factor (sigma-70 family)